MPLWFGFQQSIFCNVLTIVFFCDMFTITCSTHAPQVCGRQSGVVQERPRRRLYQAHHGWCSSYRRESICALSDELLIDADVLNIEGFCASGRFLRKPHADTSNMRQEVGTGGKGTLQL